MALSDNPFIGLPLDLLQEMQATWLQVLNDIALTGQSYTFPNRSLSRANLPEVRNMLVDLRFAIDQLTPASAGGSRGIQIAQATVDTQNRFAP
jgi:hypothetical protein